MKFLSIALPGHDGNISFYDGHKVYYHKLERTKQVKRFAFENEWEWRYEIQNLWGVKLEDFDEIVISFDIIGLTEMVNLDPSILHGKIKDIINVENTFLNYDNAYFLNHHYLHSLSSWMLTEKEPNVSFVVDGVGDGRTWSVFKNHNLIAYGEKSVGSIGEGIRHAGIWMGIEANHMNDIAGKVMGIQSYGRLDYEFLDFIKRFDIHTLRELYDIDVWRKFKGDNKVAELQPLDWIHTVHTRTGELLLEFFQRYAKPTDIITYSGGVAQNVIWNTLLKNHFPNLIIPPHSSDEGLSLGGIEYFRHKYNLNKPSIENFPYCQTDIAPFENPSVEVINFVAEKLVEGKIIGWYQGNGEVGPRALGNRSILMDPRIPNGKDMINKIKRRENYRPFGASVLQEHKNILFESYHDDEFMLYSSKVKVDWLKAITHVDNTCRVQTVNKSSHPFRILLERFYELSECPVLLNTSLNMAGKPIAGYPENALSVFKGSNMDILVIGNDVFQKT